LDKTNKRPVLDESDLMAEVKVQLEILENVLDKGAVKARAVKFKLNKLLNGSVYQKAYAVNMIASDGSSRVKIPNQEDIFDVIEDTNKWISESIARNFVQSNIEKEVEIAIMNKQDKYIDEMRLSVLSKKKGPEKCQKQGRDTTTL